MNVVFTFGQLLEETVDFAVFAHCVCVVRCGTKVWDRTGSTSHFLYMQPLGREYGQKIPYVRGPAIYLVSYHISVGPFHCHWRNKNLIKEKVASRIELI
jgi:hypothetical protein